MDIEINPHSDEDSKKQGKIRKKRQQADPTMQIIVRTLICIVVMDSLLWGYFAFIKKVSFVEGIKGWTTAIHKSLGYNPNERTKVETKVIILERKPRVIEKPVYVPVPKREYKPRVKEYTSDDQIHDIEIKNKYIGGGQEKLYSWKDDTGKIHYSNTGFPEGNIERLWIRNAPKK
jgi:hypothetical protein